MDYAHKKSDEELRKLEKRLAKEYRQAADEMHKKTVEYFERFAYEDAVRSEKVINGELSEAAWENWREKEMLVGKQWKAMSESLADDCKNVNSVARAMIEAHSFDIYALNFNFGTYEAEMLSGVDTAFTLYNREAIARMARKNPRLLPKPGKKISEYIREGKAKRWAKKQIQSVATQGILQGESIPKIAKRLANEVADSNMKSAVRNARTMTTSAENGGRLDSYRRAKEYGIGLRKTWQSTQDSRTRDTHRALNNETVDIEEEFSNGLMFPGDTDGEPSEVYNCRCTMVAELEGVDYDVEVDEDLIDIDYEVWIDEH